MSIFGMSLKIISDIEEYLLDKDEFSTINLNNDDKESLLELKGMKSDIADMIISYRPFTFLDEIEFIPGISIEDLEKWEEFVIPKLQFKYNINTSSPNVLKDLFSKKQLEVVIENRDYNSLDELIYQDEDDNFIIDRDFIHNLAMTEGISLTRDIDNVTEEEFHEYEEFVDSQPRPLSDLASIIENKEPDPLREFVNSYASYF